MCGIGGFYKGSVGGETPIDLINDLWVSLENRGTHAAGVCIGWGGSDRPIVKKAAKTASKCSKMLKLAKGKNTQYVLLHTRYTTQGSTSNNGNNHPVVGHGITLTHNGVLSNDTHILNKLGVKPLHDVDTEAINAALSLKSPKWMIENIKGSMSIAWVDSNESPNAVHLLTNGRNPLVIGRTKTNDIVWASTKTHLEDLGFEFTKIFDAIPFKQYTLLEGGRITSKIISKNIAWPMNNRQVHSSQKSSVSSTDWNSYFNNTYGKVTKASKTSPKAKKSYSSSNARQVISVPGESMEDIEQLMWDLGFVLCYNQNGMATFKETSEVMHYETAE